MIRLSKKYLPGMAVGFQHESVEVIVGDGFEFLKQHKNEFDVIITDSSDPDGPAESLFQKPYFELLFAALRDGGVITTQGCKPLRPSTDCYCIITTARCKSLTDRAVHQPKTNGCTWT